MSMNYDCMTPEELSFWRASARDTVTAVRPCIDCPAWFEAQAKEAGCCRRTVRAPRRPGPLPGRTPRYATEEERLAARRETWRMSKRRLRAEGVQ